MLTIIDAIKPDLPKIRFFTGNYHAPIETLIHHQKDLNGENDFSIFLGWLNQAIRTFKIEVQNNPNNFAQRVLTGHTQYDLFPTYDKEEARSIIEQIAKDVQGKLDLKAEEVDRLCVNIILGKEIELNENQKAHKDLVKHLIISHLSQFSELINTFRILLKEKFLGSYKLMTQETQTRVNKIIPEIDLEKLKEHLLQEDYSYITIINKAKSKQTKASIADLLHKYLIDLQEAPNQFQIEVAKTLGNYLNTNAQILNSEQINTIGDYWDAEAQSESHLRDLANTIIKLSLGESTI